MSESVTINNDTTVEVKDTKDDVKDTKEETKDTTTTTETNANDTNATHSSAPAAPKGCKKANFEKDVVYLYQFSRTPTIPSVSPFCLKVETWLRLAGLKYEVSNLSIFFEHFFEVQVVGGTIIVVPRLQITSILYSSNSG